MSKRIKRNIFFLIAIVAVNWGIYSVTKITRAKNALMLRNDRFVRNVPESERIKDSDPYHASIIDELSNQYYKNYSNYNSYVTEFLFNQNPRFRDILLHKKYSSIYDVLSELRIRGLYNEEYVLIKKWIESPQEELYFSRVDITELKNYLWWNYYHPAIDAFNSCQIDRATEICKHLFKRLKLIDIGPLDDFDPYTNASISKMYLECAMLESPRLSIIHYSQIKSILSVHIVQNDYENISHRFKGEDTFNEIINFFEGLNCLQRKEYKKAYQIFDEADIGQLTPIFRDLIRLQKARVIFWMNDADIKLVSNPVSELSDLLLECNVESFKTDIGRYINEISSNE